MARELFAAGFVSCWAELDGHLQEQLVRSLEAALASPTIPPGALLPDAAISHPPPPPVLSTLVTTPSPHLTR
eukprot:356644-Chlamydomonas_euryale.AAC.5